jgi:hypothetical protein
MPADRDIIEIEPLILELRGQKVLVDKDLAALYGVPTRRLNEQVRRNRHRFPDDFMFQLTKEELENWKSQIATSNPAARMSLRKRPYAFTEHSAIMAATILNSPRAIEVSVFVVRAFVKLRQWALAHKELTIKLARVGTKSQRPQRRDPAARFGHSAVDGTTARKAETAHRLRP